MADDMTTTTTDTSQDVQTTSQDTATDSTTTNSTAPDTTSQNNGPTIEELIQKAVDRATNKLGNDNKKLRESLEKLKRENLSAEQRKELELKEKEADIADREAKLQDKINREYAMKAIKEAGLDDGSSKSLELIDFVVCSEESETLARVNAFKELVNTFVKAEVDKTFRKYGRDANGSSSGDGAGDEPNVAKLLGQLRADQQKESENVLNYYMGGN